MITFHVEKRTANSSTC